LAVPLWRSISATGYPLITIYLRQGTLNLTASPHNISVQKAINIPSLLDLAAMKAFALGRRSKWKDNVDPPDSTNNNCYAMQAGIYYSDIFRKHFWLLIAPKTFQVYYEDFDDSGV